MTNTLTISEAKAVASCDDPTNVIGILRRGQFTTFLGRATGDAHLRSVGVEGVMRAMRRLGQMINEGKVLP